MNQSSKKGIDKNLDAAVSSTSAAIQFPALSFSQGLVTVITSLDRMTRCTRLGFKTGYYKGLHLIDSVGNHFWAVSARKIRTLPFKFTFGDFLSILGWNPWWEVELIFECNFSRVSLDEVKKLIFKSFKRGRDFWEEMCNFEEFRDRIGSAASLEQVFGIFKEFNQF